MHRESATPDYFATLRIPFVAGRRFTSADDASAPPVAIVNESFARKQWPGVEALGKRFKFGQANSDEPWVTVVGVVRDVKQFGVRQGDAEGFYLPFAQSPPSTSTIVMRVAGDPALLATSARKAIARQDPELAVFAIETMPATLRRAIWQPRLQAALVSAFGLMALILAAVGVYSVIAYAVAQRTREIGVRMALGAQQSMVVRLILGQGVRLTLAGVGVGLIASLAGVRLLRGLLFGVSPTDPTTFAGVPAVLLAVAVLACYLPARRAARVDPSIALRADQ